MLEDLMKAYCLLPTLIEEMEWSSLVVNRRKPHTYRASCMVGGPDFESPTRICLHRFEACDASEAFAHPHPWPGAFLVLDGRYRHKVWKANDLSHSPEKDEPVVDMILVRGSKYSITSPLTWHSVRPLTVSHTLMVNREPWSKDVAHEAAPTTAGKDLDKMDAEAMRAHFDKFLELITHPLS
jgi:hypothetical protein